MRILPDLPVSDDLLQPTLTADDDASEMRRPWNPWSLVVLSFFCGLPAGGGLLALNFSRLGMRHRLWLGMAVVTAGTLVIGGLFGWLMGNGSLDGVTGEQRQIIQLGQRAAAVVIAMPLAALQRRRFHLFQATGAPAGSLWVPGILAALLSTALSLVVYMVFYVLGRGSRG